VKIQEEMQGFEKRDQEPRTAAWSQKKEKIVEEKNSAV